MASSPFSTVKKSANWADEPIEVHPKFLGPWTFAPSPDQNMEAAAATNSNLPAEEGDVKGKRRRKHGKGEKRGRRHGKGKGEKRCLPAAQERKASPPPPPTPRERKASPGSGGMRQQAEFHKKEDPTGVILTVSHPKPSPVQCHESVCITKIHKQFTTLPPM